MQFVTERPFTVAACGAIIVFTALPAAEGSIRSLALLAGASGFAWYRYRQHQQGGQRGSSGPS